MDLGFETGGWCPPGRVCDSGQIPPKYNLIETQKERSIHAPDIPRSQRTENNVMFSDATLVLIQESINNDIGTEWSIKCAHYYHKPCIAVNPYHPDARNKILEWIGTTTPEILNVAGPSEKTSPGIYKQSYKLLIEILIDK